MRIAGHVERELASEAADAGDQGTQALDGRVSRGNVDAGARVGGAALAHVRQTPGNAAWKAGVSSVRPSVTGVDVTGTEVG